jgi:hypothetical protein
MSRRHGRRPSQTPGCCQLVAIAFAVLVASQVLVLVLRVLHEVAILSATLIKWVGMGLAGVVGIAAVVAGAFGVARGFGWLTGRFRAWRSRLRERRQRRHPYYDKAREWQRGIVTTVRRLRGRGWLSRQDAARYHGIARASVKRLRALDRDLATLRSVPASDHWEREVEEAAQTVVDHLQRTHHGLVRLLAESAVQRGPAVEMGLREAADDLESLLAALEDLEAGSQVGDEAFAGAESDRRPERETGAPQAAREGRSSSETDRGRLPEPPVEEVQQ